MGEGFGSFFRGVANGNVIKLVKGAQIFRSPPGGGAKLAGSCPCPQDFRPGGAKFKPPPDACLNRLFLVIAATCLAHDEVKPSTVAARDAIATLATREARCGGGSTRVETPRTGRARGSGGSGGSGDIHASSFAFGNCAFSGGR